MSARLIAYLPDRPALVRLIRSGEAVHIGRAPGQDVRLDHPSVSREHATLSAGEGAWVLQDRGSKNGSFINGERIARTDLLDHSWLRFGDVACEFEAISEEQASHFAGRLEQRRATSMMLAERLEQQTDLPDLLRDTVQSVCELGGCERGFLLLLEDGALRVASAHALGPGQLRGRDFCGSVGAVDRCVQTASPVVSNEAAADPLLGRRASIVTGGLRTLVCLPLMDGDSVLGVVYADSRQPGALVTELDVELLQAFTGRAALWIAAHRDADSLRRMQLDTRWDDIRAAHAADAGAQ